MPYVFTISYIPNHKTREIAKIWVDTVKEFRSKNKGLTKEIIPNSVKARKDFIEVIGVHEIKPGKLEEYLLNQQNYMVNYHEVEGFRYEIEVRFNISVALEMLGMKAPEPE